MPPAARSTLRSIDRLGEVYLQKELAIVSVEYRQLLASFLAWSHFLLFKQSTFQVRSVNRL